jgi:hypothetical protein
MPSEKTLLGEIVDIRDPLYQGRAKIRVFGFFDDVAVEDIPWAEQIAGLSFGGGFGGGNLTLPRLGTIVAVHFEAHNYYKMTYHYIKEISPDLLDKLKQDGSYEGSHYMIYDSEASPGPLHLYYNYGEGLVFELDDSKIQIDTNGGNLRVVLKLKDDEVRMEDRKVIIKSGNIELGEGATEKLVLGDTFLQFFNQHTHATPAGPSSPPASPMTPAQLSFVSKTK